MKVYKYIDLVDFEAWSGGLETKNDLTEEQLEVLQDALEDIYPDGMDETQLNDILWFERDWIAEILGFDDYDDLLSL